MTINDLENDSYVQKWLTGLAARSKKNYLREFPLWISFVGMSPSEQVAKRLKNLSSQDLTERTFFESKFREFKETLESTGKLRPASVKTRLRTVASFFSRIGISLDLKRGDWQSTQETEVIQRLKVTKDDVKALYAHATLRDRSVLLVLSQSGVSEVDATELKIEDFPELYSIPDGQHLVFEKPREKTGEIQATCLSYEAIHDLRAMLAERNNPKEGYLFVSQTKGRGERLEVRRINDAIKTLAEKTFGAEKAKQFKTKALRSFYNSALLRADIKSEIKDLMMGHARLGARGHYDYDAQTILDAYSKAFDHLSINGLQVRQDVAKLKEDMNQIIGKQQVEISELRETVNQISQILNPKVLSQVLGISPSKASKLVKIATGQEQPEPTEQPKEKQQ
jgi:hypothetical protein